MEVDMISRRNFMAHGIALAAGSALARGAAPNGPHASSDGNSRATASQPDRLAAAGLHMQPLGLGTLVLGAKDNPGESLASVGCDVRTAHTILDAAVDGGVNTIDTADIYGHGRAERVVGQWLRQSHKRDAVVLASKCRFRMDDAPDGAGASLAHIVKAVEASLRRLGTDVIDLYQVHAQDLDVPEEETLGALERLRAAGKIRCYGVSNYTAVRLARANAIAAREELVGYATLQAKYNLVRRAIEVEHLPECAAAGMGVLCWAPLAEGYLTGKYADGVPAGCRLAAWPEQLQRYATPHGRAVVATLLSSARECGVTPAQLALAWLLRQTGVACVISGVRTLQQLRENLGALHLQVPDNVFTRLSQASAPHLEYPYSYLQREFGRWS
jgi:aryl-alcohol dehydrogenase-like predicted oxidoreductase